MSKLLMKIFNLKHNHSTFFQPQQSSAGFVHQTSSPYNWRSTIGGTVEWEILNHCHINETYCYYVNYISIFLFFSTEYELELPIACCLVLHISYPISCQALAKSSCSRPGGEKKKKLRNLKYILC